MCLLWLKKNLQKDINQGSLKYVDFTLCYSY